METKTVLFDGAYHRKGDTRVFRAVQYKVGMFNGINNLTAGALERLIFSGEAYLKASDWVVENPDSSYGYTVFIVSNDKFEKLFTWFDATYILSGGKPCGA